LAVLAVLRICSFYFDLVKDLILISVLGHVSEYVLLHHFEEVGGVDLDFIRYYLTTVLVTSQVAKFVGVLVRREKVQQLFGDGQGRNSAAILAMAFPVHFAMLEKVMNQYEISKVEFSMATSISCAIERTSNGGFEDEGTNEEKVTDVKDDAFSRNVQALAKHRNRKAALKKHYNRIQIMETVFERLPQATCHLALALASGGFPRLNSLLYNALAGFFNVYQDGVRFAPAARGFGRALVILSAAQAIVTSGKIVHKITLESRTPASPPLVGVLLHFGSVLAVLAPKMILIAACLLHAPWIFPLTLAMDALFLWAYRRVMLGATSLDASFAAALVSPVFMRPPTDAKEKPLWELPQKLQPAAGVIHAFALSVTSLVFVYLPAGLVLEKVVFAFEASASTAGSSIAAASIWLGVGSLIVHPLLATAYYWLGHNWRLAVRTSPVAKEWKSTLSRMTNKNETDSVEIDAEP